MPTAIAKAIAEGFKLLSQWNKDSHVRRLRVAIDNSEKYIMCSERTGIYKKISEDKRKKYLSVYRRKFFKYNQG